MKWAASSGMPRPARRRGPTGRTGRSKAGNPGRGAAPAHAAPGRRSRRGSPSPPEVEERGPLPPLGRDRHEQRSSAPGRHVAPRAGPSRSTVGACTEHRRREPGPEVLLDPGEEPRPAGSALRARRSRPGCRSARCRASPPRSRPVAARGRRPLRRRGLASGRRSDPAPAAPAVDLAVGRQRQRLEHTKADGTMYPGSRS